MRFSDFSWPWARIVAQRLDTGEKKVLIEGGSDGRYSASGHLLFAREGRLMAVRFDADRLEIQGEVVPVLDGVVHAVNTRNSFQETGAAQYGTSRNGLMVYAPGSVFPERHIELAWVDRSGREEPLELPARNWACPRVSPDGRELLLSTGSPGRDVWIYDVERQTLRRQTVEGSASGIWGSDRGTLTLNWNPEGPEGIWVKKIDSGSERGEEIVSFGVEGAPVVSSWTQDGRRLAFSMITVNAGGIEGSDIWVLDRGKGAEPWIQSRFYDSNPEFSPDGRWLAYCSDVSGRSEVYVRPFPGPGRPFPVSTDGGSEPCWARNGGEIFYLQNTPSQTTFYAVKVQVDNKSGELRLDVPRQLFSGPFLGGFSPSRGNYDVSPDGRFIVRIRDRQGFQSKVLDALAPTRIELVLNWFEELRAKVPVE
jgi:serine/threonine-protein kinase